VTGLETAFAVLYSELVEPGLLPLATLLERLSAGPARIFGLDRPRIAAGARANLVLLDLGTETRVTADGFRSRSANSWLLGRALKGRVAMTVAAGALVYDGRRLDGARPGAEASARPAPERNA
jgi:dihydroorotase